MRKLLALTASLLVIAAAAIEPPQNPAGAPPTQEPAKQEPAQQEPAKPSPEPAQEPAAEKPSAPATESAEPEEEEELPPLPPDLEPPGPSPQRFNPTEKVRADFPVSFPIDI